MQRMSRLHVSGHIVSVCVQREISVCVQREGCGPNSNRIRCYPVGVLYLIHHASRCPDVLCCSGSAGGLRFYLQVVQVG